MAVEMLVKGLPAENIHPKLKLYLNCCPALDLNLRFLPRDGGYLDQNWEDIFYFELIERRIKEISNRGQKV